MEEIKGEGAFRVGLVIGMNGIITEKWDQGKRVGCCREG